MHEKSIWILRKIPRNVKPTETNSRQRFRISHVNFWPMKVTTQSAFTTSISIFNLKMEFWFQ